MTTYYVIHAVHGDIIYLSDIEPPNSYNAQGHHVYESDIPLADLKKYWQWSVPYRTFVPKNPNILTKSEFLKKFTPQEYTQIKSASTTNSEVDYYWQIFMVSTDIDITDSYTITGVNLFEQLGLIAAGRAAEILNG